MEGNVCYGAPGGAAHYMIALADPKVHALTVCSMQWLMALVVLANVVMPLSV